MPKKGKKVTLCDNLATYQSAIKAHFIMQFGEDSRCPGEPKHIPDSCYAVVVNGESLHVHIRNNRIVGIGRITPKVFPELSGCKH